MRTRNYARRGIIVTATALGAALAIASVAMACIPYKGKMEVEGDGAGATSNEVVGNGRGMGYCPSESRDDPAALPNPDGKGMFRITLKPSTKGECVSALPPGGYGVRFWSGSATPLADRDFRCFSWNGPRRIGDIVVMPDGSGTGTYAIPAGSVPGYGAVCVESPVGLFGGNRVPILLL